MIDHGVFPKYIDQLRIRRLPAMKEFKSELGNVAITKTHVERQPVESEDRELIEKNFDKGEIVDRMEYSQIDGIHVVE